MRRPKSRETLGGEPTAGPTVYLHIGVPKSGTTYIQSRFMHNADLAKEQGLLWPGPQWGFHVAAVRDLRQLRSDEPSYRDGAWMKLVDAAKAWNGSKVLVSMEWLTGCTPHQAATAIESLQPLRVEIVCTVRDLLRSFAAQWQEMTKNMHPWSWEQFVDEVAGERGGEVADRFWRQQDIPAILKKWAAVTSWDRVHLITLPPPGADPELLWRRFCTVIGLDGSQFAEPERDNESIGVVSARLMHRVDLSAIEHGMAFDLYQRLFHQRLANKVLGPRRAAEGGIAVSTDVDAWVRSRAEALVGQLRELDLQVEGDLGELLPTEPLRGRRPDDVTDGEILQAGVEALVGLGLDLYDTMQELRERNAMLRRRLSRMRGGAPENQSEDIAETLGEDEERVVGHGDEGLA